MCITIQYYYNILVELSSTYSVHQHVSPECPKSYVFGKCIHVYDNRTNSIVHKATTTGNHNYKMHIYLNFSVLLQNGNV